MADEKSTSSKLYTDNNESFNTECQKPEAILLD
jgi:hypothetical protein